jgi:glucose-1-phosphate thymidylyltransferase
MTEAAKGLVLAGHGVSGGFLQGAPIPSRQLMPVANKPLLAHALESLAAAGVTDVGVVVTSKTAGLVEATVGNGHEQGVQITYLHGEEPLALPDVLRDAASFLADSPSVAQTADGLLRADLGALLDELSSDDLDALLLLRPGEPPKVPGLDDQRLLHLVPSAAVGKSAGLASIHLFGPRFTHAASPRARAKVAAGWWPRSGSWEELLEANRLVLDELEPERSPAQLVDSDVQGRVAIGPDVVLESTVVRGPAVIGAGARLRHAYVGPYTSIGEKVEVEGAEIEHSIVLTGASIKHLGRRLEASIVGREARVFRDFALPRALRLRLADRDEISLA